MASHLRSVLRWTGLAVLTAACLFAQRYTFRQYGPPEGLTNLVIQCLLQDREGYLWAGTDNGVFRYDGNVFRGWYRADGLPSQNIRNLAESPAGELWVITEGGIARRSGNRFERVETGDSNVSRYSGAAFDSAGSVYLIQDTGLVRGDAAEGGRYRFRRVASGKISALSVGRGGVWFARDEDLLRLEGEGEREMGRALGLPRDRWIGMIEDAAGTLWVRSRNRLFSLAMGGGKFVDRSAGVPENSAWVARLARAAGAGVLVPSDTGAAIVREGGATELLRRGLPVDTVRAALMTRDGSLWLGTYGRGLLRRQGRGEWLSWQREDGLPHNTVWVIHRDREGRTWVGTSGGLSVMDREGKITRTWTTHDGLTGSRVEGIVEAPGGEVFVSTRPLGVTRLSAGGDVVARYGRDSGLRSGRAPTMVMDAERRLWVAAYEVCYRSTGPADGGARLRFEEVPVPGLSREATFTGGLTVDSAGAVWVGTTDGLARYAGGNWRIFRKSDGLLGSSVISATEGGGAYWVHYSDSLGLTRLQTDGDSIQVKHYSARSGLSSDAVYGTVMDEAQRLWVATDNGVDVLSDGRWRHYGMEDGLISGDCDEGAIYSSGREVWIGTSNGLTRFVEPKRLPGGGTPLVFSSIAGGSRNWQPGEQPVLPYDQRSLLIQFGSLRFFDEAALRFRYRLAGEDDGWKETRERSVHYAGLAAGSHTFELEAAGAEGGWSETPLRLRFSILAPWWQTWWFRAGCSLALLSLVWAVWSIRVRVLVAQKASLEKLVAQRTAELQESHRKLEEIAYFDSLTQLANRRMFAHEFERRLVHASRHGGRFALVLIDLDRFKPINDRHGHDVGDWVLVETARRLRETVREDDCVARLGGDEFAVLFTCREEGPDVDEVCRRIVEALSRPIRFQGLELRIGSSVGSASHPADGATQDSLYKLADVALYAAKRRSQESAGTRVNG